MQKRFVSVVAVLFIAWTLFAINKGFRLKVQDRAQVKEDIYQNGDLIFQTNTDGQGKAIQLATGSEFTHVGILFKVHGIWKVYEAVEPVSCIALDSFIQRGDSGHYVIKRLKHRDSVLQSGQLALMKSYLEQQLGKNYDPYFSWSDKTMYCSELVWKAYQKGGITLGSLRSLKSFDLTDPTVKSILKERYGKKIPYGETVVSPGDIYESENLELIGKTGI